MNHSPCFSIGFSPCPNDTFIFYALANGKIPFDGFGFQQEIFADVETLNQWAFDARLDITKLSFHALGHVADEYVLLKSGSALGRGCGPLLVFKEDRAGLKTLKSMKIAVPGKYTTAALLMQMRFPDCVDYHVMPFDKIMPAIFEGKVDAGVIIHESRFTYKKYGLSLIEDLGAWWEIESGLPIPLGGIAAKRSLGREFINKIDEAINKSVCWASENLKECRPYIKKYAQELDDHVIDEHISLYVNNFSKKLGDDGLRAVRHFLEKGNAVGAFECDLENIVL